MADQKCKKMFQEGREEIGGVNNTYYSAMGG
jgi:hypothetical protein